MSTVAEITVHQARAAALLRRRWPRGLVVSHPRTWGTILEVRCGGHAVEFLALTADGGVERGADLRLAV